MRDEPDREPCPLCPRVEVLPMPEPIPRPTRFLFSFAFFGARRLERLRIAMLFLAITPAAQRLSDSLSCAISTEAEGVLLKARLKSCHHSPKCKRGFSP